MRLTFFIVISLVMQICCGMICASESTLLTIGGTGSGIGFMRLLAKNYSSIHPEITVNVLPSLGSTGGIRAVKNGAIDIAVSSRHIKKEENVGLQKYFLGKSPFVFAAHPTTEAENVTLNQVINIYNGTISVWRDGTRIRRILRPDTDSDWQMMRNLSNEMATALDIAQRTEGLFLAVTDTDASSYLERIRGSFGPTTLTMIKAEKRRVKVLSFNGLSPKDTGFGKDNYPLFKPYYLLTGTEASGPVNNFIKFVLSDQGQQILAQAGIMLDNQQCKP